MCKLPKISIDSLLPDIDPENKVSYAFFSANENCDAKNITLTNQNICQNNHTTISLPFFFHHIVQPYYQLYEMCEKFT